MTEASHVGSGLSAQQVLDETTNNSPAALDQPSLQALLEATEIVRDDDTCLAGRIRILSLAGSLMVQEQTQKGQILVHRVGSLETAHSFVDERLATYERMWDGCGCKVDYSRPPDDP
jgi:hypothetical protein